MPFRVIRSADAIPPDFGPCALTIGNFDGVHAGHRELMRRVAAHSRKPSTRASVLTFDPHPSEVVAPQRVPHMLTTMEQRLSLMQSEKIEQVLILPFTLAVARLTPEEFVKQLLVDKLKVRWVVVGENFRFGAKATGNVETLRELGNRYAFQVEPVKPVVLRDKVVSSSEIRKLIGADGEIGLANRMLERPYGLEGRVVAGHGIGSKETVPTLNLETDAQVLPASGVYVSHTWDMQSARQWKSVTNIGYRPTFGGDKLSIETFLLSEFDGETPKEIRVEFLQWIRPEKKFATPLLLKRRIIRDVGKANAYFAKRDSMR